MIRDKDLYEHEALFLKAVSDLVPLSSYDIGRLVEQSSDVHGLWMAVPFGLEARGFIERHRQNGSADLWTRTEAGRAALSRHKGEAE